MRLPPDSALPQRALADTPAEAHRAAELLRTPGALLLLRPAEAEIVVAHMRLVHFAAGTTLFREGDQTRLGYMLLVLEGEVSVDTSAVGAPYSVPISVLGPGSVLGEMAFLDGSPRSATCVAISPVRAAGLSNTALEGLIDRHPKVAAKLLISLGARIADRLRGLNDQLQLYARMTGELQAELERLQGARRR
jgi:CRP/FNR family transcriptional regulator, cyclic AMP receptor protein